MNNKKEQFNNKPLSADQFSDNHAEDQKNKNQNGNEFYENIEKLKEILKGSTEDVRKKANDLLNSLMQSANEQSAALKTKATEYTVRQPLKAIGMALLSGVVMGYCLLNRSKSRD